MSSGDSRPPSDDSDTSDTAGSPGSRDTRDVPSTTLGSDTDEGLVTRFRTAQSGPLLFIREMLTSVLAVVAIGLLLFAISGVWPPMVAVESGSMEPHMEKGDLIFITEPGRFAPDSAYEDTGVVTYQAAQETDYRTFGSYGSVIIYDNPDSFGPPIIHRARFWVDEGENWYDEANPDYVGAENCQQLRYCPAPHAGFITKGDNNAEYDQANGIAPPVRAEWVQGIARIRIPYLGWVRLGFSGAAFASPADTASAGSGVEVTTTGGGGELVGSNVSASNTSAANATSGPSEANADPTNETLRADASVALASSGTAGAVSA
ncbi:signal peptidase, endoplasmic reticulum-type [Halogranum rubrum]|uniref:Signal peptidase, endoplasmic reticulum-type n=1 Tax=Halogranum rubrum TaxID=553466 RepID=A0A1I4HCS1_9EURY|nr:S26 family signal peptidase [Halogranum rubrum]SFL39965.1 signal peptidase, endoplasmic reticulum-type [Halogranum rubrum]